MTVEGFLGGIEVTGRVNGDVFEAVLEQGRDSDPSVLGRLSCSIMRHFTIERAFEN